jgi:signal transduction histidine kinase
MGSGAGGGSSSSAPLFPAPGLADLDRLLSRTAGAGVRVDVTRVGEPRDLPASIDLSAYRIVQEALTNVVKHAQTSSCRILIGYWDDELTIEVADDGAGMPVPEMAGAGKSQAASRGAPVDRAGARRDLVRSAFGLGLASSTGGGHGIIGMRERVSLLGGEFSAGPLPGYGFRVSARIPLPSDSTPAGT